MRKVLIPLNPSQTARAYGSGVTRVPTARTLANPPVAAYFSIWWLYIATLQLPSSASKPSWATTKSKWRPGPATAWLEWTVAQGRRPGPRPGETTGRYSIFFFVERFNSPLSGESHSNPSQTARPGAYSQGSDTRAHRDCLNLNLPPNLSIGWLYVATLQHPSRAS